MWYALSHVVNFVCHEEEKRSLKVLWRMEMMEASACVNMSCLYDVAFLQVCVMMCKCVGRGFHQIIWKQEIPWPVQSN